MATTSKARPAQKPARAIALCDGDDPAARKIAGVENRKKTIASTMVYAGIGPRASARVKAPAAKKPAAAKLATKKTRTTKTADTTKKPAAAGLAVKVPAKKPSRAKKIAEPDEQVAPSVVAQPVVDTTTPSRKRLRTHSQFISRIADTIAGQLDAIDAITRDRHRGEAGPSEAERHARAVAALARVSAELRKEQEADRRRRADDDDSARDIGRPGDSYRTRDPDRPCDLDELRERLSRRLDIRLGGGSAVSVADDAAGGGGLPQ